MTPDSMFATLALSDAVGDGERVEGRISRRRAVKEQPTDIDGHAPQCTVRRHRFVLQRSSLSTMPAQVLIFSHAHFFLPSLVRFVRVRFHAEYAAHRPTLLFAFVVALISAEFSFTSHAAAHVHRRQTAAARRPPFFRHAPPRR